MRKVGNILSLLWLQTALSGQAGWLKSIIMHKKKIDSKLFPRSKNKKIDKIGIQIAFLSPLMNGLLKDLEMGHRA